MSKKICILSQNGMSYIFNNVENFNRESFGISFEYRDKATGTYNKTYFSNVSITGYSFLGIDEEGK
ncbi:hypothetical protein [Vagococcus sp.]|uniref:hypothetical protein n=1 Tax=Vagococcus sp. TaxID=1933889 RepID=UPI003F9554D3